MLFAVLLDFWRGFWKKWVVNVVFDGKNVVKWVVNVVKKRRLRGR